jgi:hypothetical protein
MTNQSSKEIWAFWKGIEGDSNVYFSTSGGSPPAADISAVAAPLRGSINGVLQNYYLTSSKPATIALPDRLLFACTDANSSSIYFYAVAGATGQPGGRLNPRVVPNVGTAWAPSLAASTISPGDAIMAWNGVGNDTRIWLAKYNASQDTGVNSQPWSGQYLANTGQGPLKSGSAPAIVSVAGALLMVWRGEGDNDNLYWSKSVDDGQNWVIAEVNGHLTYQQQIAGAGCSIAPALTETFGTALLAFKGGRDTNIYIASYTPNQAEPWSQIRGPVGPFGTSHGPSLATFNNQTVLMTWKGVNDEGIYYTQVPIGNPFVTLTNQTVVGNQGTTIGPCVVAY